MQANNTQLQANRPRMVSQLMAELLSALLGTICFVALSGQSLANTQDVSNSPKPESIPHSQWVPLKATFVHNVPFVEVRVGEAVGWFLLDTGSETIFFDEEWTLQNHLETVRGKPRAGELAGALRVSKAVIAVGPSELQIDNAPCLSFAEHSKRFGLRIVGVLGYEFFMNHAIRLRYADEAVDIADSALTSLPSDSLVLPVEVARSPRLSILLSQGQNSLPFGVVAMFDTGSANNLIISTKCANRLALVTVDGAKGTGMSFRGPTVYQRANRVGVDLGVSRISDLEAAVGGDPESKYDVLLGSGFFSDFSVILDYHRSIVVLSPRGAKNKSIRPRLGFRLSAMRNGDGIAVINIEPGRAQAAGLRVGDVILSINGNSVVNSQIGEVNSMLQNIVKNERVVVLHIQRGKQSLDVTIELPSVESTD